MNMIAWIITLAAAVTCDHFIRNFISNHNMSKSYNALNGIWKQKSSEGIKILYEKFIAAIALNLGRYGIIGKFDIEEVDLTGEYTYIGEPLNIGIGIVKNKVFYDTETILNGMQKYTQNSGNQFNATDEAIEDKYIVEIYAKHDTTKEFAWNDMGLYNNVEVGDELSMSYNDQQCLGVGYVERKEKDGTNTENLKI